jgi:hypothetical protein
VGGLHAGAQVLSGYREFLEDAIVSAMLRLKDDDALALFLRSRHVKVHETARLVQPMGPRDAGGTPVRVEKPVKLPPRSEIEALMSQQILLANLPRPIEWPQRHRPFYPQRKYEVDFCWPDRKLVLEIDGHVHRIKRSFKDSFERSWWFLRAGWVVLHVGGDQVRSGEGCEWLRELLIKCPPKEA